MTSKALLCLCTLRKAQAGKARRSARNRLRPSHRQMIDLALLREASGAPEAASRRVSALLSDTSCRRSDSQRDLEMAQQDGQLAATGSRKGEPSALAT